MQTDRKKIGIFIIIIGLILLGLIIYFGLIKKTPTGTEVVNEPTGTSQLPTGPETGTTTPGDKPVNYQRYDVSKEKPHKFNENDLAKTAKAFTERFGSYSVQSNYGNFTDLKIFMTDSFKEWIDKYVETLKSQNKNNLTYYGITTRALTTEVKNFDDAKGVAEIVILTERQESTEKINGGEPYRQKLTLNFVKLNNDWLVDKAYWEK